MLSSSGHIASIVNPPENSKASYRASPASTDPAEAWQAGAPELKGSWWPDFLDWLGERAGPNGPAPESLGGPGFTAGDPAPGRYVLDR